MLRKIVEIEGKCSWLCSFLETDILQGTLLKLHSFPFAQINQRFGEEKAEH